MVVMIVMMVVVMVVMVVMMALEVGRDRDAAYSSVNAGQIPKAEHG
jgi:hypothetical protein